MPKLGPETLDFPVPRLTEAQREQIWNAILGKPPMLIEDTPQLPMQIENAPALHSLLNPSALSADQKTQILNAIQDKLAVASKESTGGYNPKLFTAASPATIEDQPTSDIQPQ